MIPESRRDETLHRMGVDLERLGAMLARAEGRRDALEARRATLEREIALAKGRLALKSEVEAFVEALQADASQRNLASFEALLTALVREILPAEGDAPPIVLELATERGQLSLDVSLLRPDGTREDVLEDNGGALTNVVGMGLRLIAVVKAGAGRFLALDEADCWIAPERVPAFYRVLGDCAARVGVQCLAISHHDVAGFDARLQVAHLVGAPGQGVRIHCPDPEPWDDAAPGFRYIRLIDVQGYKDATLTLGPGVNALVGPNNSGKSTLIRALRAVFYGEARDSLVRHGAKAATIELGLAQGRSLRFSRQPRRTPVNLWSLHEADGAVVEEHGMRFETGGRAVPDWVDRVFGIAKHEQLDLHIAHQKFPVFLLGEPGARRAAVLSIGQESGYARDMLVVHKERVTRDANLVRTGERELGEIRDALAALTDLDGPAAELAHARALMADVEQGVKRIAALERHTAALAEARRRLAEAGAAARRYDGLPAADRLGEIAAGLEASRRCEDLGARVLDLSAALAGAEQRLGALAGLPEAAPNLVPSDPAEDVAARLARLRTAVASAQARAEEARRDEARVAAEIAAVSEALGGLCPTCGAALGALPHAHAA